MDLATSVLVGLSNLSRQLRPPDYTRYVDDSAYSTWQMANAARDYEAYYEPLRIFAAKVVLDLGCGDGGKTVYYAQKEPSLIVGMDVDVDKIHRARRFSYSMHVSSRCHFIVGNVETCPFPPNSFDTILSEDCFEHYPDPEAVLGEAQKILRPGGFFIVRFATYYNLGGPHLQNFIRLPWAHLVFSDETMVKATRTIAKQLAHRYPEECRRETFESQAEREILQFRHFINKITLSKWRQLIKRQQGWRIVRANTQGIRLPVLE